MSKCFLLESEIEKKLYKCLSLIMSHRALRTQRVTLALFLMAQQIVFQHLQALKLLLCQMSTKNMKTDSGCCLRNPVLEKSGIHLAFITAFGQQGKQKIPYRRQNTIYLLYLHQSNQDCRNL